MELKKPFVAVAVVVAVVAAAAVVARALVVIVGLNQDFASRFLEYVVASGSKLGVEWLA